MFAFAERTGLDSPRPPQRYLWTDAFALSNFLVLAQATAESRPRRLAQILIGQVHRVLGRHRNDDGRRGWISGLDEVSGEEHPTHGGLRIGKPLPERAPGAPFDERLEWERDGQYFHYLTRWMEALDRAAFALREPQCNRWACELAAAARRGFVQRRGGRLHMTWKMSIDLSRTLVPSMGQHDPLDGLVTCLELDAGAARLGIRAQVPDLSPAVADFAALCAGADWATSDALGLGGLLMDACRIARLPSGEDAPGQDALLRRVLAAALEGLAMWRARRELEQPASQRLAFREIGLAIGLLRWASLPRDATSAVASERDALQPWLALGPVMIAFWREPARQRDPSWSAHRDINAVMLASGLLPEAGLRPPRSAPSAR